ncbi:MAG: hypothetical protein HY344_00870 [Candidatus Levybacteria bacterium]|nr:hypothetical protein [Candidatus Levybacteria bacterium]
MRPQAAFQEGINEFRADGRALSRVLFAADYIHRNPLPTQIQMRGDKAVGLPVDSDVAEERFLKILNASKDLAQIHRYLQLIPDGSLTRLSRIFNEHHIGEHLSVDRFRFLHTNLGEGIVVDMDIQKTNT